MPLKWMHLHAHCSRVLDINVSQINLCQVLSSATLKVRLGSCLSLLLKWTTLTTTKINAHFKTFIAFLWEGLILEWKHTLLAPPLPLMSVNHSQIYATHSHCWHLLCTLSTNDKLCIQVKA